ncbi:MAG: Dabb family protein [Planctomycetaceae bacterium]
MPQVKHLVLLRFSPQTTREAIAGIFEALDELQERIPGIVEIASGVYSSPEGLNKGFTHGFVVTFADAASRDVYLDHPSHNVVKQLIVAELAGGLADVISFDFEVCDRFRY